MWHRFLQISFALASATVLTAAEPAATFFGDAATVYATGVKGAPGGPLYFTSGSTAGRNAPAGMKGQALGALGQLKGNLATAGLTLKDVVFVRAYLVPGSDGTVDYAGWNEAWSEVFTDAAVSHKPARTTVAVPQLGATGATLIEIEFVCLPAADASDLFASSDKLGLPVANAMLKPYGTKEARIYSGMGIKPGAALYWTAGTLAGVANDKTAADSPDRYGDMKTQARTALKRLQENLAAVGLSFKDVIFLRAFVAPDRLRDGKYDLDGWNAAYGEFFASAENPHKPARTTVTTPTFGNPGTMIEIEIIAAFPEKPGAAVVFDSTTNPKLKTYGASTSPISSGVAVAAPATFYFSAGAVPAVEGDVKAQALSALDSLQTRLAAAGLGFKDVVFLRCYLVPDADGKTDSKGWGEAYGKYFNNPTNPHKPARTTIAVQSLPKPEWKVEIDVIAVAP